MNTENEAFEGDALVTQTYRELGVEKAPERLNQHILEMASDSGKQTAVPGFLFAAWMKPLAWAATIGLSLAIVLEFSELPTAPVLPDSPPAAAVMQEEAALQDAKRFEKVATQGRAASGDESGQGTDNRDAIEIFSRQPKGKSDAVAAPAQLSVLPASAISEASEMSPTRKRAANLPAKDKSMASLLGQVEQKESDIADSCDQAKRISRESWMACIDDLRQSGAEDAAEREYEALILKYPLENRDLEQNK